MALLLVQFRTYPRLIGVHPALPPHPIGVHPLDKSMAIGQDHDGGTN